MKNTGIKKAFTLVELLVVVAVLAILSGGIYIGMRQTQQGAMDHKVGVDLPAIENAVEAYKKANGTYPIPVLEEDKNVLCFKADTSYAHCTDDFSEVAFIQTQIDNNLLTKKYLQEVPTDPHTGARYAYGVSSDGRVFQVAAMTRDNNETGWSARMVGNLDEASGIIGLKSLIRSFDSSDFVMDGENRLPYSPDPMNISARLDITGDGVTVNGKKADDDTVSKPGDTIITDNDSTAVIYFSDGSVTYLNKNSELEITEASAVEQNDNKGIITKIKLRLNIGKIWNKVIRLSFESEFNVETTSAIAGVRGTEFGMEATGDKMIVHSGAVLARLKTSDELASSEPVIFSTADIDPKFTAVFDKDADTDEDFLKFTLVKETGTMAKGDIIIDTIEFTAYYPDLFNAEPTSDYFPANFNNNVIPRILNIDTTEKPDEVIVFRWINGIDKVHAFDADNTLLHTWKNADLDADTAKETLTINPSVIFDKGSVSFRFEDTGENRSGISSPAIGLISGVVLTEALIYNIPFALDDDGDEEPPPTLDEVRILASDNIPRVAADSDKQLKATAVYSDGTTKNVTNNCNWSADDTLGNIFGDGTYFANANADGLDETIICEYDGEDWDMAGGMTVLLEIKASCFGANLLNDNAAEDDKGYWDNTDNSCWVLADASTDTVPGDSCDTACGMLGPDLICDTSSDWNDCGSDGTCGISVPEGDDGEACLTLDDIAILGTNFASTSYAPYWSEGSGIKKCTPRNSISVVKCNTETPFIAGLTFSRICSCQKL